MGVVERRQPSRREQLAEAASWTRDTPVPQPVGSDRLVLILESLRALSAVRRQVRAFLAAGLTGDPGDAGEDAVERAILVIDELTSNALRHGSAPSRLHLWDEPGRWLVIVSDAAPHRQPTPAVDRPAGAGGYGLYVIADLTSAHGVDYEPDVKLVWACLDKPTSAT